MSLQNPGLTFRERSKSESDYQSVSRIVREHQPDLCMSVKGQKRSEETRPDYRKELHLLASLEGADVGYGHFSNDPHFGEDGEFFVEGRVLPHLVGTPIDRELWDEVLKRARAEGAKRFLARSFSLFPATEALLSELEFERVQDQLWTFLNPPEFDPLLFEDDLRRVTASGIRLATLAELEAEGVDWKRPYYETENEILKDVPMPTPFTPEPFEEFLRGVENPIFFERESNFVALDSGQIVGLSMLLRKVADPTLAGTGLTGTRREYRRRGLAKALKVRALTWAKENGVRRIVADNEKNNPMYLLNLQLGFRDAYIEAMWRRVA